MLPYLGLALGVLLALPVLAKEGDTFRPFVSYARHYDSNLLRLDYGEQILGNGEDSQRSDQYSVLSAGVNVDWKPGRQNVIASATKNRVRYSHYSIYDNDGSDYQLKWSWRLGNHWSGQVGATDSVSQSSFESTGQINNQVTKNRRFGRAEWDFHPRWRIGGGVDETDNTNSDPSQVSNDSQQQAQDVALSYSTPKGSNLRVQVRRVDSEFPNPKTLKYFVFPFPPYSIVPTEVADSSYKETAYNLLGDWRVSGKLTMRGQVGWVDRKYENVLRGNFGVPPELKERPDFSGFAGRMSADWYATGKTLLSVALYQELGDAQDINATTVLKTGGSVNGVWLMREKWRLNAGVTYENRDFKGDPDTSQQQRNEDTFSESISLSYTPIQAVSVDVGVRAGRRDSNVSDEDYTFRSVFMSVRADF